MLWHAACHAVHAPWPPQNLWPLAPGERWGRGRRCAEAAATAEEARERAGERVTWQRLSTARKSGDNSLVLPSKWGLYIPGKCRFPSFKVVCDDSFSKLWIPALVKKRDRLIVTHRCAWFVAATDAGACLRSQRKTIIALAWRWNVGLKLPMRLGYSNLFLLMVFNQELYPYNVCVLVACVWFIHGVVCKWWYLNLCLVKSEKCWWTIGFWIGVITLFSDKPIC